MQASLKTYLILFHCVVVIVFISTSCETPSAAIQEEPIIPEWKWDSMPASAAYKIDTFFAGKAKERGFNGVYLFRDSNQLHSGVLGKANFKTGEALTIQNTFQLGSVSKTITAIATLRLIDQGKLHTSDLVTDIIPAFPYHGITIGMLLSHRSGLGNYMYVTDSLWPNLEETMSNDDVLSILENHIPMTYYKPDEKFNYCNTNYMLLASIIECVSGKTFDQYMKEEVFNKAGMQSAVVFRKDNVTELVKPAAGHNAYHQRKIFNYLDGVVGDKGVYASVNDMLALDMTLRNGVLLSDSMWQEAIVPRSKKRLLKANYGYGWRIRDDITDRVVVFHNGWWRGFKAYFLRLPEEDKMAVVLTNWSGGGFLKIDDLLKLLSEDAAI